MKKVIVYRVDVTGIQCSTKIADFRISDNPQWRLDFLLEDSNNTIKLFTNLDDDVSKLIRLLKLSTRQLEDLNEVGKVVVDKQYVLSYIPGKWFSIDRGYGNNKVWCGFSDLAQYGDTEGKSIEDCQKLAEEVYKAYLDLGFNPNNLISPSNVYRKEVMNNLDLPTMKDVPIEAMEIAYECCKGSWVESFSIGKFDKVFDYDVNSAYPYQASQLLDLRLGTWKQSSDYQKEATYGYCRCEVSIDSNFSPIIQQYQDRNYTPKGVFKTSLTKGEIDFINQWNIGFVTILDGWWFIETHPQYYTDKQSSTILCPFEQEVNRLYKQKQESIGIKKDIIKRIMAGSFYGVFIEIRKGEFGDLFMSPYAAEIEANTRLKLATSCLYDGVFPVHIAVDGLVTLNPLKFMREGTEEIGNFRLEHEGASIIPSSGLVCIEGKEGKGDFSISYNKLNELIQNNPNVNSFEFKQKKILTLAQANQLGRIQDVGKEEEISRSIEIGDNKRYYENMPETFGELVNGQWNSEAWDAETLETLEGVED